MTREEAIEEILTLKKNLQGVFEIPKTNKALDMAVKALEQETLEPVGKVKSKIYIVTYWDKDEEPVVSPFNNKDAAYKCYNYFKEIHDGCCIDKCNVFSSFKSRV